MSSDDRPSAFFERRDVLKELDRLAEVDNLLVILGAGVSADSGLPSWRRLVEKLLVETAQALGIAESERTDFALRLIRALGPISAASVAQTSLNPDLLYADVRRALYDKVGYDPKPGFNARVIADLIALLTSQNAPCTVVTTNYDQIIERAILDKESVELSAVSVTDADGATTNRFPVYHIHGCVTTGNEKTTLPQAGTNNRLVIGEADFARLQAGTHWQDDFMAGAFESHSESLFLGMSLADPNIIRYLTIAGGDTRNCAVFSYQGEAQWLSRVSAKFHTHYSNALNRRLSAIHISPLWADYFVQIGQFMSELFLRRSMSDVWTADLNYGARLQSWDTRMRPLVAGASSHDFRVAQSRMHLQAVSHIKSQILPILLQDHSELRDDEVLGLEVWGRNPASDQRTLELWSASASSKGHPRLLRSAQIAHQSNFAVVDAFSHGNPQRLENKRPGTRWPHEMATVIRLEEEPWYRLPVGVVALCSSHEEDMSCIGRLTPEAREMLWSVIMAFGSQLLDPDRSLDLPTS